MEVLVSLDHIPEVPQRPVRRICIEQPFAEIALPGIASSLACQFTGLDTGKQKVEVQQKNIVVGPGNFDLVHDGRGCLVCY